MNINCSMLWEPNLDGNLSADLLADALEREHFAHVVAAGRWNSHNKDACSICELVRRHRATSGGEAR